LRKEAINLASVSDLVLYIGGLNKDMSQDCEGDDRKDMSLPYGQDGLINEITRVNKNVVVLNLSGNAVEMPWINKIKGLMQVWYLGSEAGNAIADVLCGNIDPSGKLPFTFPIKLSDNASGFYGSGAYPGDGKNVEYKEDILVGYRWHDTKKIPPLFPFGFGMSYTSFALKNAALDKDKYNLNESLNLFVDVTNTGKVSGAEVVQVYISKPKSKIQRALKELKGFKKVELSPMETRKIEIPIKIQDFAYYNEAGKCWIVEPGIYQILIGTSSRDIKLIKEIEVK
jgi:beta-glucosidase